MSPVLPTLPSTHRLIFTEHELAYHIPSWVLVFISAHHCNFTLALSLPVTMWTTSELQFSCYFREYILQPVNLHGGPHLLTSWTATGRWYLVSPVYGKMTTFYSVQYAYCRSFVPFKMQREISVLHLRYISVCWSTGGSFHLWMLMRSYLLRFFPTARTAWPSPRKLLLSWTSPAYHGWTIAVPDHLIVLWSFKHWTLCHTPALGPSGCILHEYMDQAVSRYVLPSWAWLLVVCLIPYRLV